MRKILLLIFLSNTIFSLLKSQVVEIAANAGTSAVPALGSSNYVANESIYTEAEIGASNFTTAATAMTRMALNVNTVGTGTTFNNVKIYFKDVPLATTTFTSGTYSTAGYTEVFSGSITAASTGFVEFALTTPYVRAAGTNLQVLIERTDNVAHTGYVWRTANGNNTSSTINTTRRYNGTVALSGATSLTVSAFRQSVRFVKRFNNDANLNVLYTLGKVPIPNNASRTDSVNVSNIGLNALTNVNVTLTISGANSYTNTKTISNLAVGASANVVFDPYTLVNEGNNTYTVSLANDDNNTNNTSTITQLANKNTWSYAYGSTAAGGVGFNGATGDFVAKFSTNAPALISQITVNFFSGGQPYQIGIWDATGVGGSPGTNLYTSPTYTSVTGVNVQPVSPTVNIPAGNFYVGVRQTGTLNVSFAYQVETPIRAGSFYFSTPSGNTTWSDFAPANSFRFMIEPKLILPTDAGISELQLVGVSNPCNATNRSVSVRVSNPGSNSIAAGAVNVTLRIRGANTFTGTANNSGVIASGASEVVTFTGINLPNSGICFDTAFISYTGDLDLANDTVKSTFNIASVISSYPVTDNAEASGDDVLSYLTLVSGARQLWGLQTGNYTNADQTAALVPRSPTNFYIFDSYSGTTSSAGFTSRLYSNCLSIPASGGAGSCGYKMSFWMSHDNTTTLAAELDSLYVSVSTDNGATYNRINIEGGAAGLQRHDGTLTANAAPIWRQEFVDLSAYAGQTIKIGFEGVSKWGNAFGLEDIKVGPSAVINLALSTAFNNGNNLTAVCDDQGWTYYEEAGLTNRTFLAIQWDPGNTGANAAAKLAARPSLQLDPTFFAAEDIPAKKATYTMKRYWNVNLNASTMTGPVNMRFFYLPSEKTEIETAASTFATTNGAAVEPGMWFKTDGVAFLPNATNVTPDFVNNSLQVTTTSGTLNGLTYVQMNGITSFSGGTFATGVGVATPLPIQLSTFSAAITANTNTVYWTTSAEQNSAKFVVERSTDGRNFSSIGEVATRAINGNSSTSLSYSFIDANPVQGKQYYRLQMIDRGGRATQSQIVTLRRGGGKLEIVDVRPNPTTGIVYFNVLGTNTNLNVAVRDLSGKEVIRKGLVQSNSFSIDLSKLANGMYILEAVDVRSGEKAMFKVMKQ